MFGPLGRCTTGMKSLGLCVVVGLVLVAYGLFQGTGGSRFEGLSGPTDASVMRVQSPTPVGRFSGGGPSRLAVLLTDRDSGWLGLVHGLRSFGIPFTLTEDFRAALEHRVVMVYPVISGKSMTPEALVALAEFARRGGTLVATQVLGGGLNELFGFTEAVASTTHTRLRFSAGNRFIQRHFDAVEPTIEFASAGQPRGSYGFTDPAGTVLAHYDDGTPALISHAVGDGRTYAFGLDIGAFSLLGHNNRQEGINTNYANRFQPGMDSLYLLLRDIYLEREPDAVLLATVPDGKSLSVVLTHDIDYTHSIENARVYAQLQQSQGIAATYFVQTKYVRDWNDDAFFDGQAVAVVRQLLGMGMEIASHSVAHSMSFVSLPTGDGKERYPDYRPFVKSRNETRHATLLGELRVSRYMLEATVGGMVVSSFRPGHLENPAALPQALEATGYRFSSSVTANNALTHLPFRLNYDRRGIDETAVFEFPITIEDELAPAMGSRLPQALEVARAIQRYGGLFVVLTHPNVLDHKLAFTRGLMDQLKPTAWFGTLASFGNWWSARDRISVDVVTAADGSKALRVEAPETIAGLTLEVPAGWQLIETRPAGAAPRVSGQRLLLPAIQGEVVLRFAAAQPRG